MVQPSRHGTGSPPGWEKWTGFDAAVRLVPSDLSLARGKHAEFRELPRRVS
jgi:hypothetical protein